MPPKKKFSRNVYFNRTYQAICRKGDLIGTVYGDRESANKEANDHQMEPGHAAHIVDVIGTATFRSTLRASAED